jgi:hypothetical protein
LMVTTPCSSPANATMGLIVEPGGYRP